MIEILRTRPIYIQETLMLDIESARSCVDSLVGSIEAAMRALPGKPQCEISGWADNTRTLKAGKVLEAGIVLSPQGANTQLAIGVKGTVLMLAKRDVYNAIQGAIDAVTTQRRP